VFLSEREHHRPHRSVVDLQPEHVGPTVVTHHVEVELRPGEVCPVENGDSAIGRREEASGFSAVSLFGSVTSSRIARPFGRTEFHPEPQQNDGIVVGARESGGGDGY
jgi:hypothetical protein